MTTQVLICDDFGFASSAMVRAIPANGYDVDISFAENAKQVLALSRAGKICIKQKKQVEIK